MTKFQLLTTMLHEPYKIIKYRHFRNLLMPVTIEQPFSYYWRDYFRRETALKIETRFYCKLSPYGGMTACLIQNLNTQKYHIGLSQCRATDIFVKKTGCQVALMYALEAMDDDKPINYWNYIKNNDLDLDDGIMFEVFKEYFPVNEYE